QAPIVNIPQCLRLRVDVNGSRSVGVLLRFEARRERDERDDPEDRQAHQRDLVLPEAISGHLPVRPDVDGRACIGDARRVQRGVRSYGGSGVRGRGGLGGDRLLTTAVAAEVAGHHAPSMRIRGSRTARRMSETSVPTTVRAQKIRMMVPARYMSCPMRARRSSGPMVGRLMTTETTSPPDSSCGKYQPRVLTTGAMATRVGYLSTRRHSGSPLARAISVYGLLSSSRRLARTTR